MKKQIIAASLALLTSPAIAQIAVSANDNKQINTSGVGSVVANAAPDTISVIDLNVFPPVLRGELPVPNSVVGPPSSVAVSPDESFALVSAAMRKHSTDPAKLVPDSRLTVIDLKAMKVVQTLEAGAGAAGVAINAAGTLALVANRSEGTVSVFTIKGMTLAPAGKIPVGQGDSGPSTVKFIDAKRAFVTRDGDSAITMLAVDGEKVSATNRTFYAGIRPYGADVTADGRYAAVANIGRGQGDHDTVSLLDLSMNPPRTVDTISVGPTPEGIKISPNGKYVAVVIHDGSARPPSSPLYTAFGKVVLLGIQQGRLVKLGEENIGRWAQGAVFSKDSNVLLVQNMVEKDVMVFRIELDQLRDTMHRIKLSGGGAAFGTAR